MSFDYTQWVWHNGQFIHWSAANAHLSAPAVQYGGGVFEGIRCYQTDDGPAVFRLEAHLARLFASASHYGIEIPYSQAALEEAVSEMIERNGFTACYIRPICYYGSGQPGIRATGCPVWPVTCRK